VLTEYHLDYETASEVDLEIVGLANYMDHSSTRILMANYAEGDQKIKCWEPHLNPKIPNELYDAIMDPFVVFHAWGVPFEAEATLKLLGIDKPRSEWRCEMVQARYLSLPGSLEDAGKILGLGESEAKIEDGKRLIKKFCSPESLGGEETLFGISSTTFRNWASDPEDWEKFKAYGAQDVVAERAIGRKIRKFPLPEREWENWRLEQEINRRGWVVDMALVRGAQSIVQKEMERLNTRLRELTNLENPNSIQQLQPWLQERGYGFSSVDKNFVARAMSGECKLTEEAKEVLTLRAQTSKSSIRKYTNIADMVSADGRLRHQYTFMGAARTGREAAHGVNMGNLPKPVKSVVDRLPLAIELVRNADYAGVLREFGKPLDVVGSTVRASFCAPPGKKLVVADLSAIENVGACFLSRCEAGMRVFLEDRDPYLDFAMHFYKQSYASLEAEYNNGNGDKTKRTMCKPATLGSGFGLGPGKEVIDPETGEKTWEGLLGYARAMNVIMTLEEATKAIQVFRSVYPEIPRTWKDLERAARRAIKNPGQSVGVGIPHTERERQWFEEQGRTIHDPILFFYCHGTKVLELRLPSGRSLHYIDPTVEEEEYTWKGKKLIGEKISYYGKEQNSTHWGRVPTHGGKLFENGDQAWARDILFNGMQEASRIGFGIIGDTYDEVISLVDENSSLGVKELCGCLTKKPSWMPDGVPLKAAGYEAKEYKKD
jgi:DNA polymerase